MDAQIIMIVVLILSVVLHEIAHGYAAYRLGDPTAKLQGRLSMNPLVHIDPLMSVIIPALLVFSGSSFIFGAAKPVPYNPYNLRDQKYGEAKVAAAGPAVNVLIAVVFGIILQLRDVLPLSSTFIELAFGIIVLNLFLSFFNLLPIPPLDGSKILPILLPFSLRMKYGRLREQMERNVGMSFVVIFFLVIFVLGNPLYYATISLAQLLAGF